MTRVRQISGVVIALGVVVLLAFPVLGQGVAALQVGVTPLTMRSRSDAPIPVQLTMRWSGAELLCGDLRLVFREEMQTLLVMRVGPLSLAPGEQRIDLLVPPLQTTMDGTVEVDVDWMAGDQVLAALPSTVLNVPRMDERVMVIAQLASPLTRAEDRFERAVGALALDQYAPKSAPSAARLTTTRARLAPTEAPHEPTMYCGMDVLAAPLSLLAECEPAQRLALQKWLLGGGSVLLWGDRAPVGEMRDWLERMADQIVPVGADGELLLTEPVLARPGLGRLVLLPAATVIDPAHVDWRRSIAHLWRLHPEQAEALLETGRWSDAQERLSPEQEQMRQWRRGASPDDREQWPIMLTRQAMPSADAIMSVLMPESVRMLPFGLIVLILVGFILLVGPIDWFALGLLRRRPLTWAAFPVASIGLTLVIIAISNGTMGGTEHYRRLIIHDYGPGNALLRTTQFTLAFAGGQTIARQEAEHAVIASVDKSIFTFDPYAYGFAAPMEDRRRVPPVVLGRPPIDCQLVQAVPQWDAQVSRTLDFGDADGPALPIDFASLTFDDVRQAGHRGGAVLRPTGDASVLRVHNEKITTLHRGSPLPQVEFNQQYSPWGMDRSHSFDRALQQMTSRQREGLFSVVSQVSPAGGSTLEDLPLIGGDRDEAALIVVWVEQGDIHVARCVYRRETVR